MTVTANRSILATRTTFYVAQVGLRDQFPWMVVRHDHIVAEGVGKSHANARAQAETAVLRLDA